MHSGSQRKLQGACVGDQYRASSRRHLAAGASDRGAPLIADIMPTNIDINFHT